MNHELPPIPDNSDWFYTDEALSKRITEELRREVGPQHPLFSIAESLVVIAKCDANDDVLVHNPEGKGQLFCVHLTWAGKHDQMPTKFPWFVKISNDDLTQFFATY